MKTYKVALLVDGYEQPGWMHEMVEWLVHSQDFELAALLVMNGEGLGKAPRFGVKALFGIGPARTDVPPPVEDMPATAITAQQPDWRQGP